LSSGYEVTEQIVRANGEQRFRARSNRNHCGGCSPSLHSAFGKIKLGMKPPRPPDHELRGMTVNERLWVCGELDRFDSAAKKRNRENMIAILAAVAMTQDQAIQTTDAILANPTMYGLQ
jgi:hypothetical protein